MAGLNYFFWASYKKKLKENRDGYLWQIECLIASLIVKRKKQILDYGSFKDIHNQVWQNKMGLEFGVLISTASDKDVSCKDQGFLKKKMITYSYWCRRSAQQFSLNIPFYNSSIGISSVFICTTSHKHFWNLPGDKVR